MLPGGRRSGSGALRPPPKSRRRSLSGSGALRPPPPVVAPLVPRSALLPAATPRLIAAGLVLLLHVVCPWRWAGWSFSLTECAGGIVGTTILWGRSHMEETMA